MGHFKKQYFATIHNSQESRWCVSTFRSSSIDSELLLSSSNILRIHNGKTTNNHWEKNAWNSQYITIIDLIKYGSLLWWWGYKFKAINTSWTWECLCLPLLWGPGCLWWHRGFWYYLKAEAHWSNPSIRLVADQNVKLPHLNQGTLDT